MLRKFPLNESVRSNYVTVFNGKNELLVEPANPEKFTEAITTLLLDVDSAVKFGKF